MDTECLSEDSKTLLILLMCMQGRTRLISLPVPRHHCGAQTTSHGWRAIPLQTLSAMFLRYPFWRLPTP